MTELNVEQNGNDINKTTESKECDICHYQYYLNKAFKFQPNIWNRCHDLLLMSINLGDITMIKIKKVDYYCVITGISKIQAVKLLQKILI